MFNTSSLNHIELARSLDTLEALVFYPKIIIIENQNAVRILDLVKKSIENPESSDYSFFGDEIVDKVIHHNNLWLILKTQKIVIINIISGLQITVDVDNHKISHFAQYSNALYVLSESGECLDLPYKDEELSVKLNASTKEEKVVLKKAFVPLCANKCVNVLSPRLGLGLYKELKQIILKCPLTNLTETITINMPIQHLISWDDAAVLAYEQNMWITDLKSGDIIFDFSSVGSKCYPVSVYDSTLYYITYNATEVTFYNNNIFSTT